MKCSEFKQFVDDSLEIPPIGEGISDDSDLNTHLSECNACKQYYINEKLLREKLSQLPVPPSSRGFNKRVLKNAAIANKRVKVKSQTHGFITGFATAMSVVLIAVLLYIYIPQTTSNTSQLPEVQMALFEPKDINLVFNSPNDFRGATLSMELSANFEIAGYPEQHKLEWQANLKKGQNFISLPIISTKIGSGELVAKIKYGNNEKTFKINLLTIDILDEDVVDNDITG